MCDLVVVIPSRERAEQMIELSKQIDATTHGRALPLVVVDEDDPQLRMYDRVHGLYALVTAQPGGTLSSLTNLGARRAVERYRPRYLASMGDDHWPITDGWDLLLMDLVNRLPGPGWAYGDDGYQGARLPTAWVQATMLYRQLGWMMHPMLQHMYVDNVVLEIGRRAGRIVYQPDVRIEHRHPAAGKAEVDPSYARTNRREQYERDRTVFDQFMAESVDLVAADVRSWVWPSTG